MGGKINSKITPILIGLLVVAAFLVGSFWTRIQYLEKGKPVAGQETPAPSSHPLEIINLKKYVQELGLDLGKFNECLDKGVHQEDVKNDITYGESLGVAGTPAFFISAGKNDRREFINGRFLGGAFPFENFKEIIDKEMEGKGSDNPSAYSETLQRAAAASPPAFKPKAVEVKIEEKDPIKGAGEAKVTIVEFSDFQCPYCARASETTRQILENYQGKVRIVYKQFPLQIHEFAQKAAEASLCAHDQGKFWEYHDKLFEAQGVGLTK